MGNKIMLVSQESHRMDQQSNFLMVSIKYYVLIDTNRSEVRILEGHYTNCTTFKSVNLEENISFSSSTCSV
jgi:hypothetical protein